MNQLNKLIQQYERENPGKSATVDIGHLITVYQDDFVEWQAEQIEFLASRPTCGEEQRKFLDEVENNFEMPNNNDDKTIQHKFGESLIDGYDFEDICDLQKVIKGE